MLRRVFINNKKVPVPVPVRTLSEMLAWVEATLVPAGHSITRVCLDERVLTARDLDPRAVPNAKSAGGGGLGATILKDDAKLEIQIDSPTDLTLQTLDAIRNLASVIVSGLKTLAVECWQARGSLKPIELDSAINDSLLILDLIEHVSGLIDPQNVEAAATLGIGAMLKRASVGLAMARANSDWKGAARILLNKYEPLLKDLMIEAETLHLRIATMPAQAAMASMPKTRAPTG